MPSDLPVAPLEELPPGTMKLVEHEPYRVGVYNCGGRAARDRGSLLPRRRAALPRQLGRRGLHRRLPAPRRELRPRERPRAVAPAYLPVRTFPVRVEDGVVDGRARGLSALEPVRCWPTTDAAYIATTTRNGDGRSATSAASTSGSASRASSRASRG